MKLSYDFHIHSVLSGCADREMTPCNIVAYASLMGLGAISVTDHNSIKNIPAVMECGEAMGVIVVPGIEVQTSEDIHIIALFKTYYELQSFFLKLNFPNIPNKSDIFGEQWIMNSDDNIVGMEENMLSVSSDMGIYELVSLIQAMGGLAIPAHIDREANGILITLGEVPEDLLVSALEFSPYADNSLKARYKGYKFMVNSDAHSLNSILDKSNTMEVDSISIDGIFNAINSR